MKRVLTLVLSISVIMVVQPVVVNAITDIDDKCIRQAYEIGYDLDETNENVMTALAQLETDCIYSEMMSQKCLVWW
jgi:cysteinyl-tRNA synthetase